MRTGGTGTGRRRATRPIEGTERRSKERAPIANGSRRAVHRGGCAGPAAPSFKPHAKEGTLSDHTAIACITRPPLSCALTLALLVASLAPRQANAQALPVASNAAAVAAAGDELLQRLSNVAATMPGNASIIVNDVAHQLSANIEQLRVLAHDEIDKPLATASLEMRALANQIGNTTARIDALLSRQRQCLSQDLDAFLAGLETELLELKAGAPLVEEGRPRVASFKFGDHLPNVVPPDGGRFVVSGSRLWSGLDAAVDLMDESRKVVLRKLTAKRANDDDSISLVLDRGLISTNAGRCLQLHLRTKDRKSFLHFFHKNEKLAADLFVPMCIGEHSSKVVVSSGIDYSCRRTERRRLEPQAFRFDNSSCDALKKVTLSKGWSIPPGCAITSVEVHPEQVRNRYGIDVAFKGSVVTASGWIDTASCAEFCAAPIEWGGCGMRVEKLFHSTIWSSTVVPIVTCETSEARHAETVSEATPITTPRTDVCLDLLKECDSDTSSFWYTVSQVIGTTQSGVPYASPHINANSAGAKDRGGTWSSYEVSAGYLTRRGSQTARICVGLVSSGCDY